MLVLEGCHVLSRVVLAMRCFRIAAVQERRIGVSYQESFLRVSSKACLSHRSRERCRSHFSVPDRAHSYCCSCAQLHGQHQSWWVSQVGRTLNNAECWVLKNRYSGMEFFGRNVICIKKSCKLWVYHKKFNVQILDRDRLYQIFAISILPSVQPGTVVLPGNSEFHKLLLLLISSLTLPNTIIQNRIILRYTNFFLNLNSI